MKIKLLICAVIGGVVLAFAAKDKDPVLMTINGKDVRLSEFDYLYNKNNQQQVQEESLDQYVDRFIVYKLKVADAEAEGLDTLKSFLNEFNGYKKDLVKPYLEDTTVTDRLQKEAYERMKINVDINHMMLPLGSDKADNDKQLARLDSIRNCILAGESFEELAGKFSVDPSYKTNKSHYGFIASGVFPYSWEKVVYDTPVGEMCKPFRTDFGNHMVLVNARREDPGQVEAEHILLLTRNMNDSAKAVVKQRIDSIYSQLKNGADFEEMAKKCSEDRGSARNGGKLGWFGVNRMVPEFEKAAFETADGEISEPFETAYGFHIVKTLGHKGIPSYEEALPSIKRMINSDERSQMSYDTRVEQIKEMYNYKSNEEAFRAHLLKELNKHGQYDSAFVANLAQSNFVIYTYGKEKVPASVLVKQLNPKAKLDNPSAAAYIAAQIATYSKRDIMQHYMDNIIDDDVEFSNLIREYRDGMLLFEVSNRKVWDGAAKDTEGLQKFFEENRSKYSWSEPHFKGIILSAKTDSVMTAVKEKIPTLDKDSVTTKLHKHFGSQIKMERMLCAKGENATADRVVFGDETAKVNKNYPLAFVLEGGVINQPETVNDVKGLVTSDYQDVLEKNWLQELKEKYPVKVNKSVLKKLKK